MLKLSSTGDKWRDDKRSISGAEPLHLFHLENFKRLDKFTGAYLSPTAL